MGHHCAARALDLGGMGVAWNRLRNSSCGSWCRNVRARGVRVRAERPRGVRAVLELGGGPHCGGGRWPLRLWPLQCRCSRARIRVWALRQLQARGLMAGASGCSCGGGGGGGRVGGGGSSSSSSSCGSSGGQGRRHGRPSEALVACGGPESQRYSAVRVSAQSRPPWSTCGNPIVRPCTHG